jgi:hypothetical protein
VHSPRCCKGVKALCVPSPPCQLPEEVHILILGGSMSRFSICPSGSSSSAHRVCIRPPSSPRSSPNCAGCPSPTTSPQGLPPRQRRRAGVAPGRWRGEKSAFKIPIHRTSGLRVWPPSRPPPAPSRATSSSSGRAALTHPTSLCCLKPSETVRPARRMCTRPTSRRPWRGCPMRSPPRRKLSTSRRPAQAGRPWPNCNRAPPHDARRRRSQPPNHCVSTSFENLLSCNVVWTCRSGCGRLQSQWFPRARGEG